MIGKPKTKVVFNLLMKDLKAKIINYKRELNL